MKTTPDVLSDVAGLLAHLGAGSLEDAAAILSEETEPDVHLVADGDDIEIRMSTCGTTLSFPVATDDFWEALDDLEVEVGVKDVGG